MSYDFFPAQKFQDEVSICVNVMMLQSKINIKQNTKNYGLFYCDTKTKTRLPCSSQCIECLIHKSQDKTPAKKEKKQELECEHPCRVTNKTNAITTTITKDRVMKCYETRAPSARPLIIELSSIKKELMLANARLKEEKKDSSKI